MEKRLIELNSFNNSINNKKEMITYFKDENRKSKKKYKKYKTLSTKMKSFDAIVNITTTSISITLSLTGFGLIVILMSIYIANGITSSNKVSYDIIVQK